jgi:L-alanine-DL-glutamate epimerase-like enolase superfamily enzyme
MKVEWEELTIEPAHPFRISRAVQTKARRVWVRVEHEGLEGWGEADPSEYYGESADTVAAALGRLTPFLEESSDPERLETLERELALRAPEAGSARAALSSALQDLVGKMYGAPSWRLWGLEPAEAPASSFTIGIDESEVVEAKAREAADWPILKIKVGTGRDREILEAVRSGAPTARLWADANAAWSVEEAAAMLPVLEEYGVEFIEQPLPPEDFDGLAALHARASLPIVVDESCLVASDIPRLADRVDGISIKLPKCGGLREAFRMVHTARACGLRVMMGCMLSSTLGIAPALHMASLLDFADLDGAALLGDDPFVGPHLERGRIVVGDEPGLGVSKAPKAD